MRNPEELQALPIIPSTNPLRPLGARKIMPEHCTGPPPDRPLDVRQARSASARYRALVTLWVAALCADPRACDSLRVSLLTGVLPAWVAARLRTDEILEGPTRREAAVALEEEQAGWRNAPYWHMRWRGPAPQDTRGLLNEFARVHDALFPEEQEALDTDHDLSMGRYRPLVG